MKNNKTELKIVGTNDLFFCQNDFCENAKIKIKTMILSNSSQEEITVNLIYNRPDVALGSERESSEYLMGLIEPFVAEVFCEEENSSSSGVASVNLTWSFEGNESANAFEIEMIKTCDSCLCGKLFDVSSFYNFNIPEKLIEALMRGAERWNKVCCYWQPVIDLMKTPAFDPGWSGLQVVSYTEEAGAPYVAACGLNQYLSGVLDGRNILNSINFDLYFNPDYLNVFSQKVLNDVMTHELGHALGIGVLWDPVGNFLNASSYPIIQSSYNAITSLNRQKTPLEDDGGPGTAGAHWEGDRVADSGVFYYGFENELMIGYVNQQGMILSDMCVSSLTEFGYETCPSEEGNPTLVTGAALRSQSGNLRCGLGMGISGIDRFISPDDVDIKSFTTNNIKIKRTRRIK